MWTKVARQEIQSSKYIWIQFEGFSVKNIPRGENEHADLLAKSAAQGLPLPSEVFFETVKAHSVELMKRAVLTISPVHSEDWRTEIISFLQGNCLSSDEAYNKRMEARTRPYVIIEGNCINMESVPHSSSVYQELKVLN
jgi:hypothetical protein